MKKIILTIVVALMLVIFVSPVNAGWVDDMYNKIDSRLIKLEQGNYQQTALQERMTLLENRVNALETENRNLKESIIVKQDEIRKLLIQLITLIVNKK
jgi:peptidoglycan hydrolase CwlO-like protein